MVAVTQTIHSFWEIMAPNAGGQPTGAIKEAIDETFGSFDEMKAAQTAATGRFGSGGLVSCE